MVCLADIKIEGSGAPVVAPTPVDTTTVDTTTVDSTTVDTTTVDNTVSVDGTTFENSTTPALDNTFTEQSECVAMSRRFLLGEEVLEEEDGVDDISGAGNGMNCGNLMVDEVRSYCRTDSECGTRGQGWAVVLPNLEQFGIVPSIYHGKEPKIQRACPPQPPAYDSSLLTG